MINARTIKLISMSFDAFRFVDVSLTDYLNYIEIADK